MIPKAAYENMDGPKDGEEVKAEPARVNFERPSFKACDLLLTYMVYKIRSKRIMFPASIFHGSEHKDSKREFSYFFLSSLLTN
jgi:hypothetical protein